MQQTFYDIWKNHAIGWEEDVQFQMYKELWEIQQWEAKQSESICWRERFGKILLLKDEARSVLLEYFWCVNSRQKEKKRKYMLEKEVARKIHYWRARWS